MQIELRNLLQLCCHLMHIYIYTWDVRSIALLWFEIYKFINIESNPVVWLVWLMSWMMQLAQQNGLKDSRKKCNAKIFWKNLGPRYFQRPITSIRTSISSVMTPTENSVKSVRDAYCWYVHLWHHCSSSFWNNSVNPKFMAGPTLHIMMVKRSDLTLCVFSINDHSHGIKRWSVDDLWMTYGWSLICVVEIDYSTVHQHMLNLSESMRASSTCTPFPIETNSLSVCPLRLPARNPAPCLSRLGERLPVMTTEKKQQSSASISKKRSKEKSLISALKDSLTPLWTHSSILKIQTDCSSSLL